MPSSSQGVSMNLNNNNNNNTLTVSNGNMKSSKANMTLEEQLAQSVCLLVLVLIIMMIVFFCCWYCCYFCDWYCFNIVIIVLINSCLSHRSVYTSFFSTSTGGIQRKIATELS